MNEFNLPIIVVCTEGAKSSIEIINNIRKVEADVNTIEIDGNIKGYKFHNVTKYYENDIVFIAHEDKQISSLPVALLEQVEGCIVYFDPDNKEFLNKLPIYANFIESNLIEFGILLCNELYDDSLNGITYKEAKMFSNILDVIELDRLPENEDDDQNNAATGHHDPVGYDELLQAIRAIIWSNVDLKRNATTRSTVNVHTDEPNESINATNDVDENIIESELAGFEQLLTEVMMFKDTTSSWSRTERLAYAEKFAFAFDNLLQNGNGQKSNAENLDKRGGSSDDSN